MAEPVRVCRLCGQKLNPTDEWDCDAHAGWMDGGAPGTKRRMNMDGDAGVNCSATYGSDSRDHCMILVSKSSDGRAPYRMCSKCGARWTVTEQRELAHLLMDERFGIGRDEAQQILRTDAAAKGIYDCAIEVVLGLLEEAAAVAPAVDRIHHQTHSRPA